jgi:plastocyanin
VGTWLRWVTWTMVVVGTWATYPRHADPPLLSATIRGRVTTSALPAVEARPQVGELGRPHGRDAADRRRSVVYLEEAPRGAFEELATRRARINQINEQFVPRVVAITTGTTVDFPNNDRIYHNVFSLSKARTFDLGRYAAGTSRAVRFDRPGIVRVFCEIHSHMSAWVLVFNHPFFAATDDEGRYAIPNVPAGTYSLAVWHETLPRETRRIVVPDTGVVDADFVLGR